MALPKPSPAFLIAEGRDRGRIVPIGKFPFRIGRQLDNEFVLPDEQVSRNHARIDSGDRGLLLVDLHSRNGVYVNDRRVERHLLSVGDRVRVGGTLLVFHTNASQVREALADSIPDSPAFAIQEPSPPAGEIPPEEPTAIRFLSDSSGALSAVAQAARLYRGSLPPEEIASQLLDLVFQGFSPDRASISWSADQEIRKGRSRKGGRKDVTFDLPEPVSRAFAAQSRPERVFSTTDSSGSEPRHLLASPLLMEGKSNGHFYVDRLAEKTMFNGSEAEQFETLAAIAGGLLERSTLVHHARSLTEQISRMEKHLSPEVARMVAASGTNIHESNLSVEKREVTILFSDIQGFTSLSERLPPEELTSLLNEYFQRMVDVIATHRGTLNKFIGDAVMALFGAPESHGNDALNAVKAGLAMLATLKALWKEIDERKRFNVRIGINTGIVVAGNIGSEKKMEYTVLGDAVNVASRLEGISPPNTVTIGARTAELVRKEMRLEEVSAVKVKGKSEPMKVYRVLGSN